MLYELATLTSPFKEENLKMFELFQKIVKCEYKPLPDNFSEDLRYMTSCKLINERERERGVHHGNVVVLLYSKKNV